MFGIKIGDQVRHPAFPGLIGRVMELVAGGTRAYAEFSQTSGIYDAIENLTPVGPVLTEADSVAVLGLGEEDREQFNDGEDDG